MPEPLMLETNVLVDYLRDRPEAVAYVDQCDQPLTLSAVVVAELYAGVREGSERRMVGHFVERCRVVPVDREIPIRGGLHCRDYHPSHNVGLADAMLAATAETEGARLVS